MSLENQILDYQKTYSNPEDYLAGTGKRLANFILDRIGLYIFLFVLILVFYLFQPAEVNEDEISDTLTVFCLLMVPGYYILFEYFFGKTPAKFITRTKVVTRNGEKPSFTNIVGRTLCRFIPFEPFSFLTSRPVGWHDSISRTFVVTDNYIDEYV